MLRLGADMGKNPTEKVLVPRWNQSRALSVRPISAASTATD